MKDDNDITGEKNLRPIKTNKSTNRSINLLRRDLTVRIYTFQSMETLRPRPC